MATLGTHHLAALASPGAPGAGAGPCYDPPAGAAAAGLPGSWAVAPLLVVRRLPACWCKPLLTASAVAPPSSPLRADKKLAFLQHMLAFAQHPYLPLADKALPMWAKLLQDAAQSVSNAAAAAAAAAAAGQPGAAAGAAAAAGGAGGAGSAGGSPRPPTVQLPQECIQALMTMAADALQRRGAHVPQEEDELPPYFDTFAVRCRRLLLACRGPGLGVGVATALLRASLSPRVTPCDAARHPQCRAAGLQGRRGAVPRPPVRHCAPLRRGAA